MQSQNKLLDDLARAASGAVGVAAGMRGEVEARLKSQFERIIRDMDLVTREEYEVVAAMAVKAREEQEALTDRVAALEKQLAAQSKPAAKKTAAKKSAPKKS